MSTQAITPYSPNLAIIHRAERHIASQPHVEVSVRFGRRLRLLRREHNLTQTRMAALFGIDRSFISDLELGKKSVSLSLLEVIALGFRMSLSDLFEGI